MDVNTSLYRINWFVTVARTLGLLYLLYWLTTWRPLRVSTGVNGLTK